MLRLLHSDEIWLKISGAYRIADDPNDPRIGPLAKRLAKPIPDRIVWGSDWPHTPRHDIRKPAPSRNYRSRISTRARCWRWCRNGSTTMRW